MRRVASSVLLSIGLASLGFGLGGGISAEFTARSGSMGFAGATTVAAWAVSGTAMGLLISIRLAFRLTPSRLFRLALIALLTGTAALTFFVWRGQSRRNQAACSQEPSPRRKLVVKHIAPSNTRSVYGWDLGSPVSRKVSRPRTGGTGAPAVSVARFDADAVIDGDTQLRLHPRCFSVVCTLTSPRRNLDLLQFAARQMTQTGASAPQIVRREVAELSFRCKLLHDAPDHFSVILLTHRKIGPDVIGAVFVRQSTALLTHSGTGTVRM